MSGAFPLWLEAAATAMLGAAVAWRWLAPIRSVDADFTSGAAADDIRAEWEGVSKTPGGRVDRSSFKAHCLKKHAAKLTRASSEVYSVFLDRLFATGTGLMLTPGVAEKADLGRHCFSYCNMLAGEFYFQQAADAQPAGSAACDYSRQPVADVLQLVPPKK